MKYFKFEFLSIRTDPFLKNGQTKLTIITGYSNPAMVSRHMADIDNEKGEGDVNGPTVESDDSGGGLFGGGGDDSGSGGGILSKIPVIGKLLGGGK